MGEPERPRLEIRDPQMMRALAHPARVAIMFRLVTGATATATELAEVVDLSPSATSYHLRALAKVGMVEEAVGRGDGRERVWQSAVRSFDIESGPEQTPEAREAARELAGALFAFEDLQARAWLARSGTESREWDQAATLSETIIVVTAEELRHINEQVTRLLRPYRRSERPSPPEGARPVSVVYRAFPPDPPTQPPS